MTHISIFGSVVSIDKTTQFAIPFKTDTIHHCKKSYMYIFGSATAMVLGQVPLCFWPFCPDLFLLSICPSDILRLSSLSQSPDSLIHLLTGLLFFITFLAHLHTYILLPSFPFPCIYISPFLWSFARLWTSCSVGLLSFELCTLKSSILVNKSLQAPGILATPLASYFVLTRPGSCLNGWGKSTDCTFSGQQHILYVQSHQLNMVKSLKTFGEIPFKTRLKLFHRLYFSLPVSFCNHLIFL